MTVAEFTLLDIERVLDSTSDPTGTTGGLLDTLKLKRVVNVLFSSSPQFTCLGDLENCPVTVRLDQLGLLFATLAFQCFARADEQVALAFLELYFAAVDDYAGRSTFGLVLTLYFQHICVFRTGTSNRSRTLIANAIQMAHDLGMHNRTTGSDPRYLRLYLMLYFADQ